MHKEIELLYNKDIGKNEWRKKDIEFLEQQQYHTDYCMLLLNEQKQKNIEWLKSRLKEEKEEVAEEKGNSDSPLEKTDKLLKQKDKERPDKGIETMFRIDLFQ
ncbi:hypothetical protein [Pedobacter sp. UC225_65]|uniref:hypothetical protein n=1 Tax=Pedobacter sp. UC225_65 TaxID=3350173 RepID=UPI00367123FD